MLFSVVKNNKKGAVHDIIFAFFLFYMLNLTLKCDILSYLMATFI